MVENPVTAWVCPCFSMMSSLEKNVTKGRFPVEKDNTQNGQLNVSG